MKTAGIFGKAAGFVLMIVAVSLSGCKTANHQSQALETVAADETTPGESTTAEVIDQLMLIDYANEESLDLMGDTFVGQYQVISFNARGAMVFARSLYDLSQPWYENESALLKTGVPDVNGRHVSVKFPDQSVMKFVVEGDQNPYGDGRTEYMQRRALSQLHVPTNGWELISFANTRSLDLMGDTYLGPNYVISFNARGVLLFDRSRYNLESEWYDNDHALIKTGRATFDGNKVSILFPDRTTMSITVLGDYTAFGDGRMDFATNRTLAIR